MFAKSFIKSLSSKVLRDLQAEAPAQIAKLRQEEHGATLDHALHHVQVSQSRISQVLAHRGR